MCGWNQHSLNLSEFWFGLFFIWERMLKGPRRKRMRQKSNLLAPSDRLPSSPWLFPLRSSRPVAWSRSFIVALCYGTLFLRFPLLLADGLCSLVRRILQIPGYADGLSIQFSGDSSWSWHEVSIRMVCLMACRCMVWKLMPAGTRSTIISTY
jgi:hypothetical protein